MRQLAWVGAIAALVMVAAFGCSKQGQADAQAKAEQARDAFVKGLQDTVDGLQADIDKLGTAVAAKGAEAKAKYNAEVKPALDKKLAEAKVALAKVKAQSALAWESTKDAAQSAVDDVKDAYNKAVKKFD